MTFVTVQFDYPDMKASYKILYDALKKSIEINCPNAKLHSICVAPPADVRAWRGATSNTVKLGYWISTLQKIQDEHIVFIDCDMIVLQDIEHVFKKNFDIAYTVRHSRYPVNGGVVFVKNNERSLKFIKRWKEINDKMYKDRHFHEIWRRKYAGINQASFGYMLEKENTEAMLLSVPCANYNCTDEGWGKINSDTHVIHIKGKLRATVLGKRILAESLKKAVMEWGKYGQLKVTKNTSKIDLHIRRLKTINKALKK